MKQAQYKDFSWGLHQKAGNKPIVCQMELTFRCPLDCRHCYTGCYNRKGSLKSELSTRQVKSVLDKCKKAGVVWLCFTGGDPLVRKDFPEIYTYAKKLGFLINVFTSLIPLNKKIVSLFKRYPPFNIETTLNAAEPVAYRQITGRDFFGEHIQAIKILRKNKLPIRVKTQVTRQNIAQIKKIKRMVESWKLKFRPSTMVFARLNQDASVCNLRLSPEEAAIVNKKYGYFEEEYLPQKSPEIKDLIGVPEDNKLFRCAIGGHAFWVSPQGRMFLCNCLRKPDYDLLKKDSAISRGFYLLNKSVQRMKFKTSSYCRRCKYSFICLWCPGRAYLEKKSLEEPIAYFCRLTQEVLRISRYER